MKKEFYGRVIEQKKQNAVWSGLDKDILEEYRTTTIHIFTHPSHEQHLRSVRRKDGMLIIREEKNHINPEEKLEFFEVEDKVKITIEKIEEEKKEE